MFLPFNKEFFSRKNLLTRKKIGWGLVMTLALWGGVCSLSRPTYLANKIYDIEDKVFCDTVVRVFYGKDDYGTFTGTLFQGNDTPYCFNGTEHNSRVLYSEFAKPGDVIIKERRVERFFIKNPFREINVNGDNNLKSIYLQVVLLNYE